MSTVEGSSVERAYKTVEDMLRGAVDQASDPKQFTANLHFCQIVGQRLLAILIFNAAAQNKKPIDQYLEQVGLGIKRELDDLSQAATDQKNMTSVEVDFDKVKGSAREH